MSPKLPPFVVPQALHDEHPKLSEIMDQHRANQAQIMNALAKREAELAELKKEKETLVSGVRVGSSAGSSLWTCDSHDYMHIVETPPYFLLLT